MPVPLLALRNVTVRYGPGAAPALRQLDLRIDPGETVALVGPSGAGKSTILGLAAGLVLPTEGTVEVLGVGSAQLGRRSHRAVRARIGSIPQAFGLVGPLRVATNVAAGRLGRWGPLTALRSLVRPVALDEIVDSLALVGIADKLWDRADRLSGGQQQRAAIARALFQQPDLFLADEPCSALDPARAAAVMAVLTAEARSAGSRAPLVSLHDAPLAVGHCQRIVGLRSGRIAFDLPAAEVDLERLTGLYALEADEPSPAATPVGEQLPDTGPPAAG